MTHPVERQGRAAPRPEEVELHRRIDRVRALGRMPRHVAIIMDGNGRWAQRRGWPRVAGHRAGVESVREIVRFAGDIGLEVLTLYAFSTENWRRPPAEVRALMGLLVEHIRRDLNELHRNGVQIRVIGDPAGLPALPRREVLRAVETTRHNRRMVLVLALNYGARWELARAARLVAERAARGEIDPAAIDETVLAAHLQTADLPDPDLLIRPSGEWRISNFLLWQIAYSELWFTPVAWPDFRPVHLVEAIEDFARRERRFGGLGPGAGARARDGTQPALAGDLAGEGEHSSGRPAAPGAAGTADAAGPQGAGPAAGPAGPAAPQRAAGPAAGPDAAAGERAVPGGDGAVLQAGRPAAGNGDGAVSAGAGPGAGAGAGSRAARGGGSRPGGGGSPRPASGGGASAPC
ncbi:isoprenyl transferase [Thermaerobacter subterraneus]|uniref:Isoprenyl transferase n=1 Tax=Thermaerobacter subterraneus DSM 13965 TaxID=867903 RepID=K6QBD8_9FIRM|nr:isoprenyl transferase [Thermaerobacter subterraneus]EKP93651.1 undecaprenyl diphosphate synthase [Thermaerobacter subterraneus DSM 13965]